MITLRQLEIFVALAEELHFGKTAEILGIPQPALSQELQKLERNVGCRLIDRSRKRAIALTESGKAFLGKIQNVPTLIGEGKREAMRIEYGETGALYIDISSVISEHLELGNVLQDFQSKHPMSQLFFYNGPFCWQDRKLLLDDMFDVSFFICDRAMRNMDGLRTLELFSLTPVVGMSSDCKLAKHDRISLRDLKDVPLILPVEEERKWLLQDLCDQYFQYHGSWPESCCNITGCRPVLQMVKKGVGVGIFFLPAPRQISGAKIVYRPIVEAVPLPVVMAWKQENHAALLWGFIDAVKAQLTDIQVH